MLATKDAGCIVRSGPGVELGLHRIWTGRNLMKRNMTSRRRICAKKNQRNAVGRWNTTGQEGATQGSARGIDIKVAYMAYCESSRGGSHTKWRKRQFGFRAMFNQCRYYNPTTVSRVFTDLRLRLRNENAEATLKACLVSGFILWYIMINRSQPRRLHCIVRQMSRPWTVSTLLCLICLWFLSLFWIFENITGLCLSR